MGQKCPFAAPLTQPAYHCPHAEEVVRRGGSEFNCRSESHHSRCTRLHQGFKAVALEAFGVEDDLLSMPHSVLVKIQFGGLLGLQRLVDAATTEQGIADVAALTERVEAQYGGLEEVSYGELADAMTSYKVGRRKR